jgi:hypothetical protein
MQVMADPHLPYSKPSALLSSAHAAIVYYLGQQGQRQGAFLWMMEAPYSSNSLRDTHICWKEPSDAKMEPPVGTGGSHS